MPEPRALRISRTHGAGRKRSNRLAQHSDLYAEAVTTDERDRRIPRLHADHATWLAHRRTKLTLTQTTLSRDVPMRAKSHCTIEKPQHSSSHRSHWMRPRSPGCLRRRNTERPNEEVHEYHANNASRRSHHDPIHTGFQVHDSYPPILAQPRRARQKSGSPARPSIIVWRVTQRKGSVRNVAFTTTR